ncbi:SDR family oxidoreductase [Dietzia alimentaria]|uniref:SDR family oxidoreductase n=1 Tax=Dietzia alimentaria TaxID=665550 RepID=UPI00029AD82D|nr:SDR family oxidoreductase [Dietzia alimentaria]
MTDRKTILITGASSGLGEGMARRWAAKGKNLALCARRLDRLSELRAELLAANPSITVSVRELDVTDGEAVERVFSELYAELGGIDRFVLNAGLGKGASIGTGKAHANRETAMVNAIGTLNQAEAAMKLLFTRGEGHLVFISSVSALRGMPKAQNTYGASKAFVSALAQGLYAELDSAGSRIKVTDILPGYIRTDINRSVKTPLMTEFDQGVDALVKTIDAEPTHALVPSKPWKAIGPLLTLLPEKISRRFV